MSVSLKNLRAALRSIVRADRYELTCRQLAVALELDGAPAKQPPPSIKDLSAALAVTKPVITRAIDKLEELKLVTRGVSEIDARMRALAITAQGRAYLEALTQTSAVDQDKARMGVPPKSAAKPKSHKKAAQVATDLAA